MSNILISPNKYIQGSGELKNLGEYIRAFGKRALIIISEGGIRRFGPVLSESLEQAEVEGIFTPFRGECSRSEISRLSQEAKDTNCDVIVGLGGGKIFDTAKAVAHYRYLPVIIVPTIASTDAPCSALSVIYSDEGVFEEYLFLPSNPNLVLMDTAVISSSPVRLTVAGMGDALATYFEARACTQSNADTCAGGKSTLAANSLARLCYDILMSEGVRAKTALEAGACTRAVEDIIEANTLLSGLGFESAGLAAAHAIHNGMTVLKETHSMYHGEKVAFGTLCQLILENVSEEEFSQVLDFCVAVDLPVTFEQLQIPDVTDEELLKAAQLACSPEDTLKNLPFEVTPDMVVSAMKAVDAFGRKALNS